MSLGSNSSQKHLREEQAQLALQQVLLREFGHSKLRNPSYSLRSFAQKIKCSPAATSEILNNKRNVSRKLAERILANLSIDPALKHQILEQFGGSTNLGTAKSANKPTQYTELASDEFKIVSAWYHFAILSLSETDDFVSDASWIAQRLNVRGTEISSAIERLERLGLLLRDASGRLKPTGKQFMTSDEIASTALRGAHAEILDLARNSLEQDEVEQRDFTTMTMAIDPNRLVKAKKMIRQFRAKLCEYLEQGDKTEVFQLSVNLFPLSRQNDSNGIKTSKRRGNK